jgi:hypothetical protein
VDHAAGVHSHADEYPLSRDLTLRDRPENEKRAWKQVFDYYVFGPAARAGEKLPEKARGVLGPITDDQSRFVRAMLINKLNR